LDCFSNNANGETNGEASEVETVENIVTQLQSGSSHERVLGCLSLSSLVDKSSVRQVVLEKKLVRLVAPLLVDKDKLVQHGAVGVLRNLSRLEPECAEEMVAQDIFTPLAALLATYSQDWQPDKVDKEGKSVDTKTEILSESLNLLWNLVEASATALKIFNDIGLIDLVLRHAVPSRYPPAVVLPSLQVLAAVCEDNATAVADVRRHTDQLLVIIAQDKSWQIKCVAVAVLVLVCDPPVFSNPSFPAIISTLRECLEVNSRKLVCDFSSFSPLEEEGEHMETEGDSSVADRKIESCEEILQAQQTALEVLTNLATGLEDEDESEDWMEEDDDMEGDEENGEDTMNQQMDPSNGVNPALVEALVSGGFVSHILARANSLPDNVVEILKKSRSGKHLLSLHETVQNRAFLCLSNLSSSLSVEDLGGIDSVYSTWTKLGTVCFSENSSMSESLLEASTSAMRSLTARLCEDQNSHKIRNFTMEDLQAVVATAQKTQVSSVKMNIISIIGDISVLAAKTIAENTSRDIVKLVGGWLVETGARDADLKVVAESLDKVFDIFGEDDSDPVFAELRLLPKLAQILPGMKVKMNAQKKGLAESFAVVAMAKTNLQRFIKYKEKRPLLGSKKMSNGH